MGSLDMLTKAFVDPLLNGTVQVSVITLVLLFFSGLAMGWLISR